MLQWNQGGIAAVQLLMGNNHRTLCGGLLFRVCFLRPFSSGLKGQAYNPVVHCSSTCVCSAIVFHLLS